MRTLIDTSCIIAALCAWHEHHEATRAEVERCGGDDASLLVAAPSLVEAFAVLTRLPAPHRLSVEDAWRILESNWEDAEVIALTASEYWRVLKDCRKGGISGGHVYDAVIAACAKKAHADQILTWNDKHFAWFQGLFSVKTPSRC